MTSDRVRADRPRLAVRLPLAAAGGLLLSATLPPRGWWPLALLGVAALAAAADGAPWRVRAAVGAAFGLALYGPSLTWMVSFTALGYVLALLLQALYLAATVGVVPRRGALLGVPGALVLAEAVKLRWPFGGLAVDELALGQVDGPFAEVAVLGGPLLVLLVVAVPAAALGLRRWRAAAAASVAVGAVLAGAALVPPTDPGRELEVAVVQAGGDRDATGLRSDLDERFAAHLALARGIDGPVDLVLFPESVVEVDAPLAESDAVGELRQLARDLDAHLVVGIIEDLGDTFWNAAVAIAPDGALVDRFDKVHRVPFGEYVPLRRVVEAVRGDLGDHGGELAGAGTGVLGTPLGDLGVAISYELWFPRRGREVVRGGAGIVLGPTRVDWFAGPVVPAQELATSRLRAVETGRPVLLASHASLSAIVAPDGAILERTDLGEAAVLRGRVAVRSGSTPFVAAGQWPPLLAAALAVSAGHVPTRRGAWQRRARRSAGSPSARTASPLDAA